MRTLLALAMLAGCESLDKATDPVWGKEPCAHCSMLVGEPRYAAQVVAKGERKYFDDIGCYLLWEAEHGGVERAWVRDAEQGRWLDARAARYTTGAKTPMDFGFEAHQSAEGSVGLEAARAAVKARAARSAR